MDENLSRGYVLLQNNKWRYSPRFQYRKRQKRPEDKSEKKKKEEEDEECLQTSPPAQSSMGNSSSSSATPSYYFQTPPPDRFNCVYLGLVLAGVGFLLPYNSFVIAVDYFQSRYPGTTIIFDMSFIYILVAFGAVIINNILVETISLYWRINFGYFLSFVTLMTVAVVEIGWDSFPPSVAYKLNLFAIGFVSFGCTVQQSSFYGYTSMLPSRYTQAVMTGESAAGLIVSINRIFTKLLLDDEKVNTLLFFGISTGIVVCCIVIHNVLQKTAFVQFYLNVCTMSTTTLTNLNSDDDKCPRSRTTIYTNFLQESSKQGDEHSMQDLLQIKTGISRGEYGVLAISSFTSANREDERFNGRKINSHRVTHSDSTEFDMPFGIDEEDLRNYTPPILPEPQNSQHNKPAVKPKSTLQNYRARRCNSIEEVLDEEMDTVQSSDNPISLDTSCRSRNSIPIGSNKFSIRWRKPGYSSWYESVETGFFSRWEVSKTIWPFMISISTAYFVTLSLFPGIESEIISCRLRSWMPVILMALFNLCDFLGKILASFYYELTAFQLMASSCLRVIFVPLFALCTSPRRNPIFSHELWSLLLSCLLGITNGIVGSLPMILAPLHVADELKELTGNIMTLSYSVGLCTGSALAYVIDYVLGPSLDVNTFCGKTSISTSFNESQSVT